MRSSPEYDVIIIGSGFGGAMAAFVLVKAGLKVLMLERGDWVRRGQHNWNPEGTVDLTPFYSREIPLRVINGGHQPEMGIYSCVGGPSVFYGGVSLRFREKDFEFNPELAGEAQARWPISYADLEPYYCKAEKILEVAGMSGSDPCEPFRSIPYVQTLPELSPVSARLQWAAQELNLRPFRLPLAINYNHRRAKQCVSCGTCDTFACAIEAKNDLATCVLPQLIVQGLVLLPNTIAVRLEADKQRIVRVLGYNPKTKTRKTFAARVFILAAGALGSPRIIFSSELEKLNPAADLVGRYLMRHCSAIVFGIFPYRISKIPEHQKQIGIHDFYFGSPGTTNGWKKIGGIQQIQAPPPEALVKKMLWKPFGQMVSRGLKNLAGLLTMAEDQPRFENRVAPDWSSPKYQGLPQLVVDYKETWRDRQASQFLVNKAKEILRKAGAWFFYVHRIRTFSHAVGTLRMGENPHASVLDASCKYRGLENLYVADGSVFPTSAAVNPSLTIAANALRVGEEILKSEF
jgi:choline dehydrogenase-like flavoprotein